MKQVSSCGLLLFYFLLFCANSAHLTSNTQINAASLFFPLLCGITQERTIINNWESMAVTLQEMRKRVMKLIGQCHRCNHLTVSSRINTHPSETPRLPLLCPTCSDIWGHNSAFFFLPYHSGGLWGPQSSCFVSYNKGRSITVTH